MIPGKGATYETAHLHDLCFSHAENFSTLLVCRGSWPSARSPNPKQQQSLQSRTIIDSGSGACLQAREGQQLSTEGSLALCEESTPEQEQLQLWRSLATALRQRQRADRLAAVVQALLNRM